MDAPLSQQIKVGLFLTIGMIGVMISILVLGGNQRVFSSYSTIYVQMDQVQGLGTGSVVSLSGVPIGNVKEISFSDDGKTLKVAMEVQSKLLARIPVSSTVEVRTQGALGDKFLFIILGKPGDPVLEEGGTLNAAVSTDLMNVLSERGGEAANIFDVITEMKKLLVSINKEGRLDKLMGNMAETSVQLKDMSADLRKLVQDLHGENPKKVRKVLEQLDSILAKVDRGEGTLGALVNDSSLHDQLKSIVGANPRKKYLESVIRTSIEKSEK